MRRMTITYEWVDDYGADAKVTIEAHGEKHSYMLDTNKFWEAMKPLSRLKRQAMLDGKEVDECASSS